MNGTANPVAAEPVRQFSVFMENRAGRLFDLVALLAAHQVHIVAMSTIDTTDSAVNRMVVDDPDRARELLAANNFFFTECEVLVVEFSDESKLKDIFKVFFEVETNVHYVYSFIMRPGGQCAIVLNIEDPDLASSALSSRGFKTLNQRDISR